MSDPVQTPVRFGADAALVGMLTTPAADGPAPLPVACLMLNMGANHRVGPRRINVKLCHRLAARGMSSLRLDLGGIGDSEAPAGTSALPLVLRAVRDLQAAMDLVEARLGIHQFVIVGLCSGVEHAMTTALADPRVVGLSLFDGFNFPQWHTRCERTLRRAFAAMGHPAFAGKLRRWLQRSLVRWLPGGRSGQPLPGFFSESASPAMTAAWFGAAMHRLAERKVALHFLYSGSFHVCDRDRDLLGRFRHEPFVQAAQYDFAGDLDHTLCTAKGQQSFLRLVGDWAIATAGGMPAAVRSADAPPAAALQMAGALAPQ
ncbi:hypothetical protein [Xylophilus sp.]|uniref:hypothetical protein n=1 Tax=Xylophilus sp. TaxID=2653893 RepID=UPI0013B8B087|nr:hypothetical protein [Xylophilus sp.]KAF1048058.1 MAG: hypothetical protein GAK38_01529 [Xylophilus sp.]